MTTLTVAVCTRDRSAALGRCLNALAAHADRLHEVLVSSDGVDRATDDVIDAYRDRLPRLRLLRGPRLGLAANRNTAILAATGDQILFLDDDMRLDVSMLDGALPLAGEDRLVTGWEWKGGVRVTAHDPDFLGFLQAPPREPPRGARRSIDIGATLFPRSFLAVAGFDEFYRFGFEEAEIALLAVRSGLAIHHADAFVRHDHDPAGRGGNDAWALRSRACFSVRRYRMLEPSGPRLAGWLAWAPVNAVGAAVLDAGAGAAMGVGRSVAAGAAHSLLTNRPRLAGEAGQPTTAPPGGSRPTATVVVPSYRRPDELACCLEALGALDPAADQVVVAARRDDSTTRGVAERAGAAVALVDEPGVVAAMAAGAALARGDVVAFTDDDARPRRDWLSYLLDPYADPAVGAVGGRDVVHHGDRVEDAPAARVVGRLRPWGRAVGRHHLGIGRARDVQLLKGANMSVRRELLALPHGLRGGGAQVASDLAVSLAVSAAGHRVVYDPRALVDHHPAVRHDEDARVGRSRHAAADQAFNEGYAISSLRPDLRRRRLLYALLVGDRGSVGLARAAVALLRGEWALAGLLPTTVAAARQAFHAAGSQPLAMRPVVS